MKKVLTLTAVAVATSFTGAYAQYIGGLDFNPLTPVTSNIAFDSGAEASNFTLNIQTGLADDNFAYFGSTEPGWAAASDLIDFSGNILQVSQVGTPTVQIGAGFAPSTNVFGGTSATAQGFSATSGIAFGSNDGGVFSIDLGLGVDNAEIAFDVATLSAFGQTAGSFTVNGQTVNATSSASNIVLSLGNLGAGESIVFDFGDLSNGATLDNFQIAGAVVPEPSTYAAIVGALALGFAAYRRRNS